MPCSIGAPLTQEQEQLQGTSELQGEPVCRLGASALSLPEVTLTLQLRSEHVMPQARWTYFCHNHAAPKMTSGLLWGLGGGKPTLSFYGTVIHLVLCCHSPCLVACQS